MVKIMKLGEMKYDIPIEKIGNGHWNYNFFEKRVILKEGKRINANSSKYDYLRKDDMVKTDDDFYESIVYAYMVATVYKGNIIKNLIMDCQSYTKYRPNETTGGIFVSWRRKEELPTGA